MKTWRRFMHRAGRMSRLLLLAGPVVLLGACGGGSGPNGNAPATPNAAVPGEQRATILSANNGVSNVAAAQPAPGTDMQVVAITTVSETRVSRTLFDFVLKVTVRNSSSFNYSNVRLTLLGAGTGTTVIDGAVVVPAVAAGGDVVATDTITIRQDRTRPFNLSTLQWRIEGTAGTTAQAQLAGLERTGQIPTLERGPTLQGIDLNSNGIRDDIDAYIAAQYQAQPQRAAALQTAQALQAALSVAPQDIVAAKETSRRISNAINCVFSQFSGGSASKEPTRVVKELEAMTTNTKARLLAYLAYNKTLDGTSSALPDGATCE